MKYIIELKCLHLCSMPVALAYKPSSRGGWDSENWGLRPPWVYSWDPISIRLNVVLLAHLSSPGMQESKIGRILFLDQSVPKSLLTFI
jgi:hypothetical protein